MRYVTDELDERQTRLFERRLADDLSAQEALARAVELIQSTWMAIELEQREFESKPRRDKGVEHVGQASRQPPLATSTRHERSWSGRPALLALASSVVVILALGWMWYRAGALFDRATGEEAVAWAALVADMDIDELDAAGELTVSGDSWENWLAVDEHLSSVDRAGDEGEADEEVEPTFEFEITDDWITALISVEASEEEGL